MKKIISYIIAFLPLFVYAQDEEAPMNMQEYSPSVLLGKGNWEYKFFNNLYTQTQNYNAQGTAIDNNARATYFTSINQFLYGISPTLNIGMDVWLKSVRNDVTGSSPFALFQFENTSNTRTAIASLGPKIKFAPFQSLPKLSIQSTFLFPIASDLEGKQNGKPYLSDESYIWMTQFFYDQAIGSKFQLFFQLAPWVYYKSKPQASGNSRLALATPISAFFSYYATDRITLYVQNEYWPSYGTPFISSSFLQNGLGLKYQIIKGFLESEILYTKFTAGKNAGAGETFNLGFRIIH